MIPWEDVRENNESNWVCLAVTDRTAATLNLVSSEKEEPWGPILSMWKSASYPAVGPDSGAGGALPGPEVAALRF